MGDRPATINVSAVSGWAEEQLRAAGTASRAEHDKAYLKSSLEHAGAALPAIRAVAQQIRRGNHDADASAAFALAEALWSVPLHERRMLAVIVLEQYATTMSPSDLSRLEPLLRDSRTWAYIDGLAGRVAGDIVLRHHDSPIVDTTLRRWAAESDFWVRRSALLAHLDTVGRKGAFEGWLRFCELADAMLDERDFFVRKATGWVLREAGKRRPDLVVTFLTPRILRISGVTFREAVRYLEPEDRDALTAAYRGRDERPQARFQQ